MLNIRALPNVSFWLTSVNIPTVSANEVAIPNPIHGRTWRPTNTITWAPMTLTFLVDEDYSNYFELLDWMNKAAGPDPSKREVVRPGEIDGDPLTTNGSIHILSNNKNSTERIFNFYNLFPTIIGELQLQNESSEQIVTDVTLQYDWMEFETPDSK